MLEHVPSLPPPPSPRSGNGRGAAVPAPFGTPQPVAIGHPRDDAALMALEIHNITFDCADSRGLATFWAGLLGWNVYYDDDPEVVVAPSFPHSGTGLLFIPVPEGKTVKNRVHLDVAPHEGTRDEAVERAVAAGATVIGDHRKDDGTGWVTMADPEGNEFCIERGATEKPRTSSAYRIG